MVDLKEHKILITGGAGFLGERVVASLLKLGLIKDNLIIPRSNDYDLRLIDETLRLFKEKEPTLVINIAARLGGIGDNRAYPASYFYDNLLIGVNVIEASRLFNVRKLVNIGTVCSYPKNAPVPFKEENLWQGYPEETNGPYGVSKRAVFVYSQAVRKQYGLISNNLVLTNLYGPGDDFREDTSHVIPAIIKKVIKAKETNEPSITAWGDGSPSRDFLYVDDAAKAVIMAAQKCETDDPINIGSGQEVNIRYLINEIASILEYNGEIIWDTSKPNGQPRRFLDTSKALSEFDFKAETIFAEGLDATISWYMKHRHEIDPLPSKFKDLSPFDSGYISKI